MRERETDSGEWGLPRSLCPFMDSYMLMHCFLTAGSKVGTGTYLNMCSGFMAVRAELGQGCGGVSDLNYLCKAGSCVLKKPVALGQW